MDELIGSVIFFDPDLATWSLLPWDKTGSLLVRNGPARYTAILIHFPKNVPAHDSTALKWSHSHGNIFRCLSGLTFV